MKQIFSFNKKEKGTGKKPVKKLVLGAVLLVAVAGAAFFVYQKKAELSTQGTAAAGDGKPEGTADGQPEGNAAGEKPTNAEKSTDTKSSGKSETSGDQNAKSSNVPEGFHEVTVTTGLTSDEYVEILSGDLSEGDEVYISQSSVSSSTDTMMPGMGGGMGGANAGGSSNRGGMGGANPGGGAPMG